MTQSPSAQYLVQRGVCYAPDPRAHMPTSTHVLLVILGRPWRGAHNLRVYEGLVRQGGGNECTLQHSSCTEQTYFFVIKKTACIYVIYLFE